jgi:hypothetical protein
MSRICSHSFQAVDGAGSSVLLPFNVSKLIEEWSGVRRKMFRGPLPGFTRQEWAYLIEFLSPGNLHSIFQETFGGLADEALDRKSTLVYTGRGPVAVWLPNNVGILGPLMIVLISLTGNRLHLKEGSRNGDITVEFLDFLRQGASVGWLGEYLADHVIVENFDRESPRNAQLAAVAMVRIAFGSDASVARIASLPSRPGAITICFGSKVSEIWLNGDHVSDETLSSVARTFSVYGTAACTSPQRVVLVDSDEDCARRIQQRLARSYGGVVRGVPEGHVASGTFLAYQLARALGIESEKTEGNKAVIALVSRANQVREGSYVLAITPESFADAVANRPVNLQTIGYDASDVTMLNKLILNAPLLGASRIVPIEKMHHFGHVWDGQSFWRHCFSATTIGHAREEASWV